MSNPAISKLKECIRCGKFIPVKESIHTCTPCPAYKLGFDAGVIVTNKRFLEFADHVGCTPNKAARYDKLLDYVKKLQEVEDYEYPFSMNERDDIAMPTELLKELGESE